MADDDKVKVTRFHSRWSRHSWAPLATAAGVIVLVGVRFFPDPFPGYNGPAVWMGILAGVWGTLLIGFVGAFDIIIGSPKALLGAATLIPYNRGVNPLSPINPPKGKKGEKHPGFKLAKWRMGGFPFLNTGGKDFAVFPDVEGAVEDRGGVTLFHFDFAPYPFELLPQYLKDEFMTVNGKITEPGFNPKRSTIWIGFKPLRSAGDELAARISRIAQAYNLEMNEMEKLVVTGRYVREDRPMVVVENKNRREDEGLVQ